MRKFNIGNIFWELMAILLIIGIVAGSIGISLGGWYLVRKWNYAFAYRSFVEQTVREMVKEEALR